MYQASWLLPELLEIFSWSLDFQEGDKPPVLLAWCPLVTRGSDAPDSFVQSLEPGAPA